MPFRHPHSEQRRPARAHAVGPMLGPHARTDRIRDTLVAEPWLPAPEDGRPGEGQRLTPDAPHNGGRPLPPGTAPHHPRGTQPPRGMQAKGTVLGPHTHTPAPTARGWRTPTARPVGGHLWEGQRLTSDAPHNGGRHPLRGRPSATPTASNAGPQGRTLWGRCWVPTPAPTASGTHWSRNHGRPPHRAGGWERDSACHQTPLTMVAGHPPPGTAPHHPHGTQPPQVMQAKGTVLGPHTDTPAPTARGWRTPTARPVGGQSGEGQRLTSDAPHNGGRHPPGDALPPPPQRATPARKGPRCGAGAGSPRPHRPHPGHTGRRTPAARPTGRAAGRGTAPDTRRPSQRWQATPPGDGPPPPPRHAAPTGHAGQGDSVGPRHPHTRDRSMWVADPNSPPSGQAVRGGGAPDHRRPSQRWKAPPREHPSATPTASNAGPQGRMLWGRCLVPMPHRPHAGHTGCGTPAARPRGRAAGGGTAPDTRRPSQRWQAIPPGDRPPTISAARSPQRACRPRGQCWAPTPTQPAPTARGWRTPTARPVGGQPGEGERLTSDPPHNGGRHPPRGCPSATPTASNAGPQGRTLWGRCWVPTPATTAPRTHGSRNPGCPP